jgi:hypothetical protein
MDSILEKAGKASLSAGGWGTLIILPFRDANFQ